MIPALVDTHCHLDFGLFDDDRAEVIARAAEAGVSAIVVPGLDLESSRNAIRLADSHDPVYAAVGFHPNSLGTSPPPLDEALAELARLAQHPRVVAVGEIGLDYYWDKTPHAVQHGWLRAQLRLAADLGLPVILHCRDAMADLLCALSGWVSDGLPAGLRDRPGVLHSFSGTWEPAERALALGFYLGFTGPLTYRKADETRRVAALAPADRVVIETDAPFLAPQPVRGRRNEPAFVTHVAARLAEVRGVEVGEAARLTTGNASRLFGLPQV